MSVLVYLSGLLFFGYSLVDEIREGKTVQAVLSSAIVTLSCVAILFNVLKA